MAFAKGGYQIGKFAKYKYSNDPIKDRISIENLNEEDALLLPNERLFSSEKVVIAEGAFRFKNLFTRADILVTHFGLNAKNPLRMEGLCTV